MSEAELTLWKQFDRGDRAARRELLLYYLPLVELVAKRIARTAGWTNWEDLKQEGVIGLMKAITKFDASRGVAFTTFAKPYIRGAIFDSSELTRDLARRQQEIYRMLRRAEADLTNALGRNATIEEVAEKTELSIGQIKNAIDAIGVAFAEGSSDSEVSSGADWSGAAQVETAVLIQEALALLDERKATIVVSYYLEERPPQEIGQQLGLTTSNVTKIRQRALDELRQLLDIKRRDGRDENT